mmetsp:Transcript_8246/g.22988  ORF Transcript_8246/g.22988 Transcript_8246/m.22988 type:complete len:284 (+) Transcript_8246:126-977(+)
MLLPPLLLLLPVVPHSSPSVVRVPDPSRQWRPWKTSSTTPPKEDSTCPSLPVWALARACRRWCQLPLLPLVLLDLVLVPPRSAGHVLPLLVVPRKRHRVHHRRNQSQRRRWRWPWPWHHQHHRLAPVHVRLLHRGRSSEVVVLLLVSHLRLPAPLPTSTGPNAGPSRPGRSNVAKEKAGRGRRHFWSFVRGRLPMPRLQILAIVVPLATVMVMVVATITMSRLAGSRLAREATMLARMSSLMRATVDWLCLRASRPRAKGVSKYYGVRSRETWPQEAPSMLSI